MTDSQTIDQNGVEVQMATLYLTEQYSVVKIEGEALRVQFPNDKASRAAGKVVRVPLAKVEQVMVLGDITLTTPAIHALLERRIAVHYLSARGRSYGALTADWGKNSGVRLAQYALFGDLARRFAAAAVRGRQAAQYAHDADALRTQPRRSGSAGIPQRSRSAPACARSLGCPCPHRPSPATG